MRLPDAVYDLFTQMIYRFGLPTTSDEGRAFIQKLAEQAAYELPEQYGQKRADPNRPISDDVLAMVHPTEGLIGWDMIVSLGGFDEHGNSTARPIRRGEESIPLPPPQKFEPVEPHDHLGTGAPEPPADPPAEPEPPGEIVSLLRAILAATERATEQLVALNNGQVEQTEAVARGIVELKEAVDGFSLWRP